MSCVANNENSNNKLFCKLWNYPFVDHEGELTAGSGRSQISDRDRDGLLWYVISVCVTLCVVFHIRAVSPGGDADQQQQ